MAVAVIRVDLRRAGGDHMGYHPCKCRASMCSDQSCTQRWAAAMRRSVGRNWLPSSDWLRGRQLPISRRKSKHQQPGRGVLYVHS